MRPVNPKYWSFAKITALTLVQNLEKKNKLNNFYNYTPRVVIYLNTIKKLY
jgi:hypothetical protein